MIDSPCSPRRLQSLQHSIWPVLNDHPIRGLSPCYSPPVPPDHLQPLRPQSEVPGWDQDTLSPYDGEWSWYFTQPSHALSIAEGSGIWPVAAGSRQGSFASSNVLPTDTNDYFHPEYDMLSVADEDRKSDRRAISFADHSNRSDLVERPPACVRQLSRGTRTQAPLLLQSVHSFSDSRSGASIEQRIGEAFGNGRVESGDRNLAARHAATSASRVSTRASHSWLVDSPSSSSNSSTVKDVRSVAGADTDPTLPMFPLQPRTNPAVLAARAGVRQPSALGVDLEPDVQARSSLTSLLDLTRRAIVPPADLDHSKTSTRLVLDFSEAGGPARKDVRQSSPSDQPDASPLPGQFLPPRADMLSGFHHYGPDWPLGSITLCADITGYEANNKEHGKKWQQCCGMPRWLFFTLSMLVLFIATMAIVIPVLLVVLPSQSKNNEPTPTADQKAVSRNRSTTCQHGGIAISDAD